MTLINSMILRLSYRRISNNCKYKYIKLNKTFLIFNQILDINNTINQVLIGGFMKKKINIFL